MGGVLIAPVTVTPTKPLSLSHLKGLLWTDVMYRATGRLTDVDYRYSHTTYDVTAQTLGFWTYLDQTAGTRDFSRCTEEEIGDLYVAYHRKRVEIPYAAMRPYEQAVEETGWVHPASARLLNLWARHYEVLGMHDPGLTSTQPPAFGLDELLDQLRRRNLCLDMRSVGGPVYLDATADGLPLRQIVTEHGQANYLACALRELVPLVGGYDETVLLCDRELGEDYLLLQRVLSRFGSNIRRELVDRVPIDGKVLSSRHGGWNGHTVAALVDACQDLPPEAVKLGMRLYFIAVLGKGGSQSFRLDLLRSTIARAQAMLAASDRMPNAELTAFVRAQTGSNLHVDPYRLTSALLAKRARLMAGALAEEIYV